MQLVLCWVDINLWPGQVQDFSVLRKCSRQRACINLMSRPNWYRQSKAELLSKVNVRLVQAKNLERGRLMSTRQWNFLGLAWHFHSWVLTVSKLWYMARIGIYFISRILSWKKNSSRKSIHPGAEMQWSAQKRRFDWLLYCWLGSRYSDQAVSVLFFLTIVIHYSIAMKASSRN